MTRVTFNDSERELIKIVQDFLKREGLPYEVVGNGNDSRERLVMEISTVNKNGTQDTGKIFMNAGGVDNIKGTTFNILCNDRNLGKRLGDIIVNTFSEFKNRSPKADSFELG